MAQTCTKCHRVNPDEAYYCFNDGNVLGKAGRNGGPPSVGNASFASAFVLPSGRACRNFDELAVACNEDWGGAKALLEKGYLETFLGGMGRIDLAQAAREAAHFPDRDRGLDQFLARLPSHVLETPKLFVEPREVSLGVVPVGQDRKFQLRLENQGMRLLYGSVTVDGCAWMVLGDAPGAPEKLFQFGGELVIPVLVKGKQLRANTKPQEVRLIVESNGGNFTVLVRVEVPVKPFPDGPLAGAKSPRQIAEKAKAQPKESAVFFQKGAVQAWYKANGWSYPVQGPSASGLGAVQQFFEALGLTPPPKVEIDQDAVALSGAVGDNLKHRLEVSTPEKKPIYAHGVSNEPWLEVGRAKLNGRTATIPLVVPAVPNRPGEKLKAKVTVTSNGNQKFVIPVTLSIMESFNFDAPVVEPIAPVVAKKHTPPPMPVVELAPVEIEEEPPPLRKPRRAPSGGGINIRHLVPAGLLGMALVIILILDLLLPYTKAESGGQLPGGGTAWAGYQDLKDTEPWLLPEFTKSTARYGLIMMKARDPANKDKNKRLTARENGETSNACVKIDGYENLFGLPPGKFDPAGRVMVKDKDRYRWTSVMNYYPHQIRVTQVVEIVPNQQTRYLDTCLVRYTVENQSTASHKVGLRVMLDTFIGANDGVPIRVPGQKDFVTSMKTFPQKDIPDYLQAWEKADPVNPGTIAHLGLREFEIPGVQLEPIEKVIVCRWPGNSETRWDWDYSAMDQPPEQGKDSCVVMYWAERALAAGDKREMAFTYGLNTISSVESGNEALSLTAGGSFRPGGVFTLTATVAKAQQGQKVTLDSLPKGLALADGAVAEHTLDQGDAQVSWRIKAQEKGEYTLVVRSLGGMEKYRVKITDKSIFD